jgi:hypothetical protein
MTFKNFCVVLGKLSADAEYSEFCEQIEDIISFLDILDEDDTFGTEGWKHAVGMED